MAFILNIDTATEIASVCICQDDEMLALEVNEHPKEHASFIHIAIKNAMVHAGISLSQISAIAVTAGPGSYTGLRVGLATAKGLCYALNKPLITANTLKVMTLAAMESVNLPQPENIDLYCPMIDARRMEVYTALYDSALLEILQSSAMLLENHPFDTYVTKKRILFFGSGSSKFEPHFVHKNALFWAVSFNASHLGKLAWQAFQKNDFVNVAYAEPNYFKEFYTLAKKMKD